MSRAPQRYPSPLFLQSVENCVCIVRNLSYHVHKEVPGADRYQEAEPRLPGSAMGAQRRRREDAGCFGGKKAKGVWVGLGYCVRTPSPAKPKVLRTHRGHVQGAKEGAQDHLCSGPPWCLDPGPQLQEGPGGPSLEVPRTAPPPGIGRAPEDPEEPRGQHPTCLTPSLPRVQLPGVCTLPSPASLRWPFLIPVPLVGTQPPKVIGVRVPVPLPYTSWEGMGVLPAQAPLLSPVLPPAAQKSGSMKVSPCLSCRAGLAGAVGTRDPSPPIAQAAISMTTAGLFILGKAPSLSLLQAAISMATVWT